MKKIFRYLLVIYFIISLPITVVFIKNEYIRFIFHEVLVEWYSKINNIDIVFIGDSNVAAGRSFSSYIDVGFFSTKNLGQNGNTLVQVKATLNKALSYNPQFVIVLAGTNDIFLSENGYNNKDLFKDEYSKLIVEILKGNSQPLITLIPYTSNLQINKHIDIFNSQILNLVSENDIAYIDLNKFISSDGVLLKKYTTDGVHLNNKGLELWGQEIQKALKE
ncbi:SGNH/GDSL hydrolase family protein [Winogradskyella aurantia]|uniref:SGNH/GDSL hydrolase family protein n=1 Tax=Winogradskyella aurantia TaxID=1915063 RepID=UPI0013FE4C31|nr:GDSL-type esterase/lipase family protein [Winogradskyella aurantia]